MSKQTGLGMNCYVGTRNVSGDIGSIKKIACPQKPLAITAIDKLAYERVGGQRDGGIDFVSWFNPSASQEHDAFSSLPTTDQITTVTTGTANGSAAASMVAKQVNYDGDRKKDGAFSFSVSALANSFGLEWGRLLTAGVRTDTTATNGTGVDFLASTSFGWQAYLHVFAFTGTDVTITLQDSADNISFLGFTGSAFTTVTTPTSQRLASASPTATVRQYVRVITTTSAGFSNVQFAVVFVKNTSAVVF